MDNNDLYQKSKIHKCIEYSGMFTWMILSISISVYLTNAVIQIISFAKVINVLLILVGLVITIFMFIATLFVVIMLPTSILDDYIKHKWFSKHQ